MGGIKLLTEEERSTLEERILKCLTEGMNRTNTARRLNICLGTLSYWCDKFGIENVNGKYIKPAYGDMFGNWKFLEEIILERKDNKRKGHRDIRWKCECQCKSKTIKVLRYYHLTSNHHRPKSESCGCIQRAKASYANWQGHEEISMWYFYNLERGAIRRSIKFDITIEYIWNLFLKQDRKCVLTGVELIFTPKGSQWKDQYLQTASLDRINSYGDYTEDNIQWIHKDLNKMKFILDNEQFLKVCKDVVKYYGKGQLD